MKKLLLFTLFLMAALGFTASAQFGSEDVVVPEIKSINRELMPKEFGGVDVLVSGNKELNSESKISVADNGWMYILVNYYKNDYSESSWKLFRSKDDGINYEELRTFTKTNYNLKSCDLVVTGKDETDINVWVGMVLENPTTKQAAVYIAKYSHDGTWIKNAHAYEPHNIKLYHCAISADYRSPGTGAESGFFISIAYTGYNINQDHSFVDYVYSQNGGESFTKELIYTQDGEGNLGRIDVSLGSNDQKSWGYTGIVFEMDKTAENNCNIGFLANFADYDNSYKWGKPIKVSEKYSDLKGKCGFPKIQWLQNRDAKVTNPNLSAHNFLISFHEWSSGTNDYDIAFLYPKNTFNILKNHTPVLNDFGIYFSDYGVPNNGNQLYPDLAYDKANNNYLLTYIDKNDAVYKFINFNQIDSVDEWETINGGVYSTAPPPLTGTSFYKQPVVDIHPRIKKACFAWTHYSRTTLLSPLKSQVFADSEWSKLSPPPPTGTPYITLTTEPDVRVRLNLIAPAENTPVWMEFAPGRYIKITVGTLHSGYQYLNIQGNTLKVYGEIKYLEGRGKITNLDFSMADKDVLTSLDFKDNLLTNLDVSTLNNLKTLRCSNNLLTTLNMGSLSNLEELYCSNNKLTALDNISSLSKLKVLRCDNNDLTTIKIGGLTKLQALNCSNNKLTSLDVSTLTNLMGLNCGKNNLDNLDVSALTNLTDLYCYKNKLTALDVSTLTNLMLLDCSENNLDNLDVSALTKLTQLNCYKNKLTALDVSTLANLIYLDCANNNFTTAVLDNIYCDLPQCLPADNAKIYPIEEPTSPGHDIVLATNKANAEDKNWKVLYYDGTPIPTTGSYECGTTGVTDIEITGVNIYPNPAHGSAVISMQESGNYTVNLYDLQGKLINRQPFTGTQYTLDLKSLAKGVYLLELETGNGSHRVKLIVE